MHVNQTCSNNQKQTYTAPYATNESQTMSSDMETEMHSAQ